MKTGFDILMYILNMGFDLGDFTFRFIYIPISLLLFALFNKLSSRIS